jgi:general secretion pathway protein K
VKRHRASRGVILVAVLWTIALLSGLAMAASTTFRSFAGVVTVHRDRLRADALLTAGLEVAAGLVRRFEFEEIPLREIETSVALSGGSVWMRIEDEGGRIDLGKAPVELLASLFRSLGARDAEALAQRVVEWRTPAGADPLNPQTIPVQDETKPPQAAAGTDLEFPFSDVRQLALVPGVPPALVDAAAPLLTVFGSATVNPLTAPSAVIAALPGLDASRARAFLDARRRGPADVARLGAMLASAQQHLAAAPQRVASVQLTVTLDDGFTARAAAVIVAFVEDAEPYRILAWNPLGSAREERQRTAK